MASVNVYTKDKIDELLEDLPIPSQTVTVASLPAANPIAAKTQEGGTSAWAAEVVPDDTEVELTIELAGIDVGYAGHAVDLYWGNIAGRTEAPWDSSPYNRVARATWNPPAFLTGVTETSYRQLGMTRPGFVDRMTVVERFTGLTPGTQYDLELRIGGQSLFKPTTLEAAAAPRYADHSLDGNTIWVACPGNNTLQLVQTGYTPYPEIYGQAVDAYSHPIARIPLPGLPVECKVQPTSGQYVAVLDYTNKTVLLYDVTTMALAYTIAIPGGDTPGSLRWNAAGTKLWVGASSATNGGRVHRLDAATKAFDQVTVIDATASANAMVLDVDPTDSYVFVTNFWAKTLHRINTTTGVASAIGTALTNSITAGKMLSNASVIVIDATANLIIHKNATGTTLGTINIASAPYTDAASYTYLKVNSDQTQILYVNDGSYGWAWLNTYKLIHSGADAQNAYYGEIGIMADDTIYLLGPVNTNVPKRSIQLWPGGVLNVRPNVVSASGGYEHLRITCKGGVITGG